MGKFVSTAILAVVALAFVNCSKDKKKTEDNLAKGIATEYTVSIGGQPTQKFKLTEVNATTVKFPLDSMRINDVTAVTIKEINPVKLTKEGDTVVLAANVTAQATVYTKNLEKPDEPAASETKSVKVTVTGKVVGTKLDLKLTFPELLETPVTIDVNGTSK
ncbi:MAG: hypothetical protein LBK12_03015 [Odoribacteraceae bacterium]|jgi:hypothetical protein|nr:hypothetical protein [Odoribacteraceae bacterium]